MKKKIMKTDRRYGVFLFYKEIMLKISFGRDMHSAIVLCIAAIQREGKCEYPIREIIDLTKER